MADPFAVTKNPFAMPGDNFRESAYRRAEEIEADLARAEARQRLRHEKAHGGAGATPAPGNLSGQAAVTAPRIASTTPPPPPPPPATSGAPAAPAAAPAERSEVRAPAGLPIEAEARPLSSKDIGDLPAAPPKWAPDSSTETCFSCTARFDWRRRRHHCRACGQVFCAACSLHRMMLPSDWKVREPQRVCERCAAQLQGAQRNLISIRKAALSLRNLIDGIETVIEDGSIMEDLLRDAKALMFVTVMKMAFIGGIRAGTGLIVARVNNEVGWSAPCAIGSFGISFGAEVGVETTDMIIPITQRSDIRHFTQSNGHLRFGGEAGLALGPLGRSACAEAAISSSGASKSMGYSHSRGVYGGVSLEGAYCRVRRDVNMAFYGQELSPEAILSGEVPAPKAAGPLYESLKAYKAWVVGQQVPSSAQAPKAQGAAAAASVADRRDHHGGGEGAGGHRTQDTRSSKSQRGDDVAV